MEKKSQNNYHHLPVMLEEVIYFLNIKKGGLYFDGTLGGGSYTLALSERVGESGLVLSTDLDPLAINNFSKNESRNTIIINDNFANLSDIVQREEGVLKKHLNLKKIEFDGLVLDLGLSSAQLEDQSRGFSFKNENSLDMSFGPQILRETFFLVNNYNFNNLERIIREYGEEPWAKKIALNIIDKRKKKKIDSAQELAEIVSESIPRKFWSKKIHPATKTFQAFRMETNQELDNLRQFLLAAIDLMKLGGRLVIVSFHSLEDRLVKNYFRNLSREENPVIKIINKKPLSPSEQELRQNPRSRSAKLRVVEKII